MALCFGSAVSGVIERESLSRGFGNQNPTRAVKLFICCMYSTKYGNTEMRALHEIPVRVSLTPLNPQKERLKCS